MKHLEALELMWEAVVYLCGDEVPCIACIEDDLKEDEECGDCGGLGFLDSVYPATEWYTEWVLKKVKGLVPEFKEPT